VAELHREPEPGAPPGEPAGVVPAGAVAGVVVRVGAVVPAGEVAVEKQRRLTRIAGLLRRDVGVFA
jgi:hypothetical protein